MRVEYPGAAGDDYVDVQGVLVPVDDAGFDAPDDAVAWLERWCDANGYDPDAVRVTETCDEIVESTGDVCGRDLPCRYHSEDE